MSALLRTLRVASHPDIAVQVLPLGLACCAVEVDAAVEEGLLVAESPLDEPSASAVLVVAGTVTTPLAGLLEAACAADPAPTAVMAFGACASTGGPYWDSPTVINGADQVVSVHRYVPGCPPRPSDLVAALIETANA